MPKLPLSIVEETFGQVIHLLDQEECCGSLEVGIFTCDKGKSLDRHGHGDCAEWCYLLEGEAIFDIEGEKTVVKQGEMILLPANSQHLSYSALEDRGFTSIFIVTRQS